MRDNLPDIWKAAVRIQTAIEDAVKKNFSRYDRYQTGAELRRDARDVVRKVRRAWLVRDPHRRRPLIQLLSDAIDELKDSMQLAKESQAFRSFEQFESIARLVRDLGRQCGGWKGEVQEQCQNARPGSAGQRASTLSTRAATQVAAP